MNIIDEIFYGNISGADCKATNEYKKSCTKELKLYEKIKEKLLNGKIFFYNFYIYLRIIFYQIC